MKIVHIELTGEFWTEAGYQENHLCRYQLMQGHEVTMIAMTPKDKQTKRSKAIFKQQQLKVIWLPFCIVVHRSISKILRIYQQLFQTLDEEKPDIIFIHNPQFWSLDKVIAYKKKNMHVKIFADNHADEFNSAKSWISKYILHKIIWKAKLQRLMPYCEMFWGVTPGRCDFLHQMYGIPKSRIQLLVLGADTLAIDFEHKAQIRDHIRSKLNIKSTDFVLISGGKLDRLKNTHVLLKTFQQIKSKKISLILFGPMEADYQNELIPYFEDERIHYTGKLESKNIWKYYLASDLAIFPGTHSVLWEEAIGTGLPCIFRNWSGMDHLDLGGNCIFISGDSVKELRASIEKLLENPDYLADMKQAAEEKGIKHFSYEHIARKSIGNL